VSATIFSRRIAKLERLFENAVEELIVGRGAWVEWRRSLLPRIFFDLRRRLL
jgi:hypothetical protein